MYKRQDLGRCAEYDRVHFGIAKYVLQVDGRLASAVDGGDVARHLPGILGARVLKNCLLYTSAATTRATVCRETSTAPLSGGPVKNFDPVTITG